MSWTPAALVVWAAVAGAGSPSTVQNITVSDVIVPLYGGLRVGEYYAKIGVGTPRVEFRVQIDTGSSLLLIPDSGCDSCSGRSVRYNATRSLSATAVACESEACGSGTCAHTHCFTGVCSGSRHACCSQHRREECGFGMHFGGGTEAQGALVSDTLHIGSITTPMVFGSVLVERGTWAASSNVDGILGIGLKALSCNPTCVNPLMYELVNDRVLHDGFSMCMGDSAGQLVMGGVDPRFFDGAIQFTPLTKPIGTTKLTYYSVAFTDVRLDAKSVFGPNRNRDAQGASPIASTAVVDSGSTSLLFEREIFKAIQANFQRDYCHLPGVCTEPSVVAEPASGGIMGERPCLRAMPLASEWPTLQLELGPTLTLHLPPHLYFVRSGSQFCYGIDATPETAGRVNIFGDTLLRGFYTVYDHTNLRVGFAQQNMVLCGFPGPGGVNSLSPAMDTLPQWASSVLMLCCAPVALLCAIAACAFVGAQDRHSSANNSDRRGWSGFQRLARSEGAALPQPITSYGALRRT